MIGSTLTEEGRNKLRNLLRHNLDVFAWKPADMIGVPRHVAEHQLNVQKGCPLVRQKKRGQAANRNQAIQEEVKKLIDVGIMKEVHYHSWLSNPVMCLVDKAFHKQIGSNLEVYIDDLVIKSYTKDEIIKDIEEIFRTLMEINMKLNPKKCTFGVEEGMFLRYKVNTKGIQVCLDKAGAILSLSSPKCLKDVQKLNGKLASMNRFLAKSAKKSLPFFKTLKKCTKKSDFLWIEEVESTFKQMKQLIAKLFMLTELEEKEELIVYLAATKEDVSAVLMTKREAKQMPIYFVSHALRGPEVNYTSMEKLVLALGQILVDFIVERPEEDSLDTPMEIEKELLEPWILFTDGSSYADGSEAGLILTNPDGTEFTYALRFRFEATNNEAEYEALIARLRIAKQMGVKNLQENVDSRLVANQVNRTYIAKEADMIQYLEKLSKQVLVEELKEKLINEVEVLAVVEEEGDTWMTPIHEYLIEETLLVEVNKARAVRRKPLQENYVLREIHEGSCSMHAGTRSVVAKDLRTGYSWPTMHKDARILIRACQDCQVHRPILRNPQQKLTLITSPWTFHKWGIDIDGPFSEGPSKVKFLIVAMDYFTKWIEAKAVATITGNQDLCEKLCIHQCFASVKHPQANGLVERANQSLREGIKARLDAKSKNWMEEISHVLWAHRTMIKTSNGDTSFSLTYGTEVIIPAEIGMPTLRTTKVDMVQNDKALEINLDLLEERREQAAIREAKRKAKIEKYYNSKVRSTSFNPGDLVYHSNDASHAKEGGKLGPKWEGPYEVMEALGMGAYKLRDDGKQLP
ncbi:reverse transcriptase domain-containing protein [Tanacetum coccineum]